MNTEEFAGKVAVITGAASGIGEATVELSVAEGAQVLAADKNTEAGAALADRLGPAVRFMPCDVTDCAQLKAAIDGAAAHFGGLDILFSNAGAGGTPAGVEGFDPAGWDHTQALLLRSVAAGAAYALPHMQRRGGGAIVNTSSVSALQAGYAPLCYSVAKAAVLHYTTVAAAELSAHRIRINAIVPGFIATRIFGGLMQLDHAQAGALAAQIAERSGTANPIGRSGMPRDIAEAALFLASDASRHMTGAEFVIDGGMTAGTVRRPD
jgi:NAD(P)-dependent dehydrogenase (short-subunit alcohol dehydrogenase family)